MYLEKYNSIVKSFFFGTCVIQECNKINTFIVKIDDIFWNLLMITEN